MDIRLLLKEKGFIDVMARPGKYHTHIEPRLETIKAWRRRGLTLEVIADNLGVALSTLCDYQNKFLELSEILTTTKDDADAQVENALFKRAVGYTFEEVTREVALSLDFFRSFAQKSKEEIALDRSQLVITKIVTKEIAPNVTAQLAYLQNRASDRWRDRRNDNPIDDDNGSIDELTRIIGESAAKHGVG